MPPVKRTGLGRGLDALLPKVDKDIQYLDVNKLAVSPFQPRKIIEPEALAELAHSVAEKGILQPLLVRPKNEGYEIVAGERRFRAAQSIGLATVPALIKELSDRETLEIAIIENLQREQLNAIEEARAFEQLMSFGLNQDQVAKAVGKSRSAIANALRLLKLPKDAFSVLETGEISAGHARAILAQPKSDQEWALREILAKGLSVRAAERLKREVVPELLPQSRSENTHVTHLEEDLARHVGTKIKIKGTDKGSIELFYYSEDEFYRLLEVMGYQA